MSNGPTKNLIEQAIERSGYLFELSLTPLLEEDGCFVTPNHNFQDQDTGKSRELDLHAIGGIPVSGKRYEYLFPVLLISCENNTNPYVFFTRENMLAETSLNVDAPISGFPEEISLADGRVDISDYLRLEEILHVASAKRVSSQFCAIVRKGKRWETEQGHIYNQLVVPLIKALAAEIAEHKNSVRRSKDEPEPWEEATNLQVYYPIVVLGGQLWEMYYIEDGKPVLERTDHVVLARHYESSTVKGQFAIDVIAKEYLSDLLGSIDTECQTIVNRIRRHRRQILATIRQLNSQTASDDAATAELGTSPA